MTTSVTPSSTTSTRAIRARVASKANMLVTPETSDWVATCRSKVVSAVTRDIRSPGSAPSTADNRSRSSRVTNCRRAASTTDSPVRSITWLPTAPIAALAMTSAVIKSSRPLAERPAPSPSISWRTTSGSASPVAPVARLSTPPATRAER